MQPIRKSTPWPPNISDEHVSCTAPATGNASLIVPCLSWRWNCYKTFPHVFAHLWQSAESIAPATQNNGWTSKSGSKQLISKCASRRNCVHPFHISTSKSAPTVACFTNFDFAMCFAPQRRALFQHLTFQSFLHSLTCLTVSRCFFHISTFKSAPNVVCFADFDFATRFAPQCRALFRHVNFQKCSDNEGAFSILTSKSASRHSRMQFLISHLSFDEMTSHPPL